MVDVPDFQGQYRIVRRSSKTYECKRCRISVSMSEDKPLTNRHLLNLAGQMWTNEILDVAGCDSRSKSILHGPLSTEHDFTKLITIAQSWQTAVEGLPMQQRNTDGPHIHNRLSCSPPELNQKHEHEKQNILGVDGGSKVPSRPG